MRGCFRLTLQPIILPNGIVVLFPGPTSQAALAPTDGMICMNSASSMRIFADDVEKLMGCLRMTLYLLMAQPPVGPIPKASKRPRLLFAVPLAVDFPDFPFLDSGPPTMIGALGLSLFGLAGNPNTPP